MLILEDKAITPEVLAQWERIILTTLSEIVAETSKAVTGAKLRGVVVRKASLEGLELPKDRPFAEFLSEAAPQARIIRRHGSDMLVVPEDRQELLPTGPDFHIRRDMFEAFTVISTLASPWYDPERDRVFWRKDDELALGGALKIPAATLESETGVRREFANGFPPEQREDLLTALSTPMSLRAFSRAVYHHQLLPRWQGFRSQAVRSRLEAWAKENRLQWRDAWLVPPKAQVRAAFSSGVSTSDDPVSLLPALARLDPDDLRRIQVPLDIVAKLLNLR